jgi:hypothetical protein
MEHNFRRDSETQALISQSVVELDAYKKRKTQMLKVDTIAEDINNLKGELEEIKTLLRQLINKE